MDDHEIVERLIPHVFLPLQLPGEISESIVKEENYLLTLFQRTLRQHFSPIKETVSVFDTWVEVQVTDCEISYQIRTLEPGQMFALYVRAQNCGLLISIPKHCPDKIIWSTFPASQKNHVVTGSTGELRVSYPAASIEVMRHNLLHSDAVSELLDCLTSNEFPDAKSVSTKAKTEVAEIRDVSDTIFVSAFLPGLLVTQESKRSFGDIPRITKKIRDNVVFKDALLPFRRSGMWTTAKVVLNISLVRELGGVPGSFVYKMIILRLQLTFLQPEVFPAMESTGIEMLKKVGRRLRKLETFKQRIPDINDNCDLTDLYDSLVDDANKIIKSAREQIDQHWHNIINAATKRLMVTLNGSHFNMRQSLIGNGLWDFLSAPHSINAEKVEVSVPHAPSRHRLSVREKYTPTIPKATTATICTDISIMLFEFERNVLHNWSDAITADDYAYVWTTFHDYSTSARVYYSNDPVGMSRSVITMLKMIQVWDRLSCDQFPLLQSYKIGIDIGFVKMLLVPTKEELEIVDELEDYFSSRQRANSCLLENMPNASSFSVKFAEQSSDMEALRAVILSECQQRSEDKIREVEVAKSHCQSLRRKFAEMDHDYDKYEVHHWWSCARCSLVNEEENYQVNVYEKPLPEVLYRQRAVVFELIVPDAIACLRDLIHTFSTRVTASIGNSETGLHGMWSNDKQLAAHTQRSLNWKVNLGSTVKNFVQSHYAALHPNRSNEGFVVNNGYNLYYGDETSTIHFPAGSSSNIKNRCTLQVESDSQYGSMQWAIDGNSVTPNEVLARQSQCDRNLSTSEFVEFGSLRCYYRLQVRNLMRATVLGALSPKNESVFNLICQMLWECSPRTKNGVREAHEDFSDSCFMQECLSIMDNVVEKHKDNWQDPYVVFTAIVFAVNVAERCIDQTTLDTAAALILKCRAFTGTWSQDIQLITSKMANADLDQKNELTRKLVEVNICRAISFSAHTRLRTLATAEHIQHCLQTVTVVNDHIDFIKKHPSNQMISLVRRVIELGVRIEEYIVGLSGFCEGMNMFLRSHYGGYEDLDLSDDNVWDRYPGTEQIYFLEAKKKRATDEIVLLQMDIVVGKFLVNGCKISRLPEAIENHADFVRVFPKMAFEVQPIGPNECVTKHSYNGSLYSFVLNHKTLIVTEIVVGTSIRRTLIPSKFLPDNFPHRFEHGFSHWWNEDNETVEFFPRDNEQPLKIMDTKRELLLAINDDRKLRHLESSRILADIRCPTVKNISKVLNRLESTAHIHVWFDANQYRIELPRMRLSFVVLGVGSSSGITIMSQEFEGMRIAQQQQLETLVGLQQGLLLTNDVERILLVPHGTVHVNDHHSIVIRTENVLEPPYFRYDVDERLGQLKAGETQTGWFYLAYLHAITSGFIPDPWTGVTGTERAFQILNSGVCFPSQPFSPGTVEVLRLIRNVAPTRKYHPHHYQLMETVHWPSYISPLAAHDNFVAVIDDLVSKSNRLEFLFDETEKIEMEPRDIRLRQKAMLRRSCVSNVTNGTDALAYDVVEPPPPESFAHGTKGIERTVQISHLCHSTSAELPITRKVFDVLASLLLCKKSLLPGLDGRDVCSWTICDWISIDFCNSWLGIYEAARVVQRNSETKEWILFLSCLAFRRKDRISIGQLSIMNAIAVHPEQFASINPPKYDGYTVTSEYEYNETKIDGILTRCLKINLEDFAKSCEHQRRNNEKWKDFQMRMKPSYEAERKDEFVTLKSAIKNQWPRPTIGFKISGRPVAKYYDWSRARDDVNDLFTRWFRNGALRSFLLQVATAVNDCSVFVPEPDASELVSAMSPIPNSLFDSTTPLRVRLNDFLPNDFGNANLLAACERLFRGNCRDATAVTHSPRAETKSFPLEESCGRPIFNEFIKDLRSSWNQWQLQKDLADAEAVYPLLDVETNGFTSTNIWTQIYDSIEMNSKIYFLSDWCPRIAPTTLLPLICKSFESGSAMSNLVTLLGGYAVTITREQQQCRIERYRAQDSDLSLLELERESSNAGHTNWSPKDRPEWLLFEIENDLLIRPLQIKVAHQMERPDGETNSLLQMNMGEGKTAVVIPLLALSLANERHLCRITVLRSLYQINLKSLALKIGGLLLNRRVYTMPCRRDYAITTKNVKEMMSAYEECLDVKGVLMTLPEHRLSFVLKKNETALSGKDNDSMAIDDVVKWLQSNARDILDESDEILQVKYQLLYTLGEPLTICAESDRWKVTQKLLKLVPDRIESLLKSELLTDQLELKRATASQEFSHCRVLSDYAYQELCAGLSEDAIATGLIPEPGPAIRSIVLKFLTQEIVSGSDMQTLYKNPCFSQTTHKDTLLILRGLLACGVLRSCLSKRWRVNYGVNPTGHKKMAVPFRAKDVAAERAEFGHPDVAIVLTLLSYYYSGLSDQQLEDTFSRLFKLNFAEEEYQSWIGLLPPTTPGLLSISKLSGINLRDYRQKYDVIFPAMRKNMATIDFWLDQAVFPAESKQFGSKIGCSAWDLCRDDTAHPTTGFSGTNDTKLLLPRTIQQRDLPDLLGTNGKVLENLLLNDHYEGLERHISAEKIIQKLVQDDIKVLLDVGAIMLELNNEQVADVWMKQCSSVEAVVFFDSKDHLVVKHRLASRATQFELSPWRNRLDGCAVYLDEIHTRGTDLKIPLGTTAVVTLGKGVRKDTLAQGCMRMRKLGQGHTIRFWGSSDVHPQIVQFVENGAPGAYAVLEWAIQNSVDFMEESFIHWAGSGIYDLQKRSAESICDVNQSELLAQLCSQREMLELMSMYGLEKSVLTYPCIVESMIQNTIAHLRSFIETVNRNNLPDPEYVLQHLGKYVGQLTRTSNILDEEQERELYPELEAETQIERPPQVIAEDHRLDPNLRTFIQTGNQLFHPSDLLSLKNVFENSDLMNYCNTATSWGLGPEFKVVATRDFERTVIQSFIRKSNDFLRPVSWIYNTVSDGSNLAILLSPFEVNELWDEFRIAEGTLHMHGPRLFADQRTLHESGPLIVPSRSGTHCIFTKAMTASLDILVGSIYFRDESDERFYCVVAGISPRPRPLEEEKLFETDGIVNCFVDPMRRNSLPMFKEVSAFQENPERFIRGVIEARHGVFSDKSHVANVIVCGRKNFIK